MNLSASARAFGIALHASLAFELSRLAADGEAFERLWKRPRRTTLAIALKVLTAASAAAAYKN